MYDWVLNATLLSVIFKFEIVMKKCVKLSRGFFQPIAFPILPDDYVDYSNEHYAEITLSTAKKMKFSTNPEWKTSFFVQWRMKHDTTDSFSKYTFL